MVVRNSNSKPGMQFTSPDECQFSPYKPLDESRKEIRLLLVRAGAGTDQLRCELRQTFLNSSAKPFETISYCWGDPKASVAIRLNGKPRKIPSSAEKALRRMRLPDANRMLWIDAVCINQDDPKERSQQVGIMYDIYSSGQANLVWLGEDDGTTAAALQTLEAILEDLRQETKDTTLLKTIRDEDFRLQYAPRGLGLGGDNEPILRFYSRPWFRRLWVAQEAALAHENVCHCGDLEFPLDDVLRAAVWMRYKTRFLPFTLPNTGIELAAILFDLVDREDGLHGSMLGLSPVLHFLLRLLRDFDTSDPRDHVYGALGLYRGRGEGRRLRENLTPDYQKPLAEVLQDATRVAILEEELSIFADLDIQDSDIANEEAIPSWVLHWHVKLSNKHPKGFSNHFTADNDVPMDRHLFEASQDPKVLSLSGFSVHKVHSVTSTFTKEFFGEPTKMIHQLDDLQASFEGATTMIDPEILGRTLIAGTNFELQRATKQECLDYQTWLEYTKNDQKPMLIRKIQRSQQALDDNTVRASRYHFALQKACRFCRLFITATGSFGLGPQRMEAEDIIAVLFGCRWPVVLRSDGAYYKVIGICYIYGIMDGEAVQEHRAGGNEDEVFHVR